MTALPRQHDSDPAAWVPIAHAAHVMGVGTARLRQRCRNELAGKGLARKCRVSSGQESWHVHPSIDRRLGSGTPDTTPAELLASIPKSQRDAAECRALMLRDFRRWRDLRSTNVRRDFDAFRASMSQRYESPVPALSRFYSWNEIAPSSDDFPGCVLALVDTRGGAQSGQVGGVSAPAWQRFEALYLTPQRWSIAKCHRTLKVEAKHHGWNWPGSARQVQNLVRERITPQRAVMARDGVDAWRHKFLTPLEQDPDAWLAGQCWEGDHSRLDLFVRVFRGGKWVSDRPWLTAWKDRRSRRVMGWVVGMNPNSDAIRGALMRALRDETASVPEYVWIDNGKDFAAAEFGGKTKKQRRRARREDREMNTVAWAGLFGMLGVDVHFAEAYNHNGKARIERSFGTLHMDHDREYPSWCGSKPGDRDRESLDAVLADVMSLPTVDDVRESIDRWIEYYNHRADHSIDALADPETGRKVSPVEFYAAQIPAKRTLPDRGALALLEQRWSRPLKVTKHGVSLRIGGQTVSFGDVASELDRLRGSDDTVLVTYDPDDTTRVRVYDMAGVFLCVAEQNMRHGGPTYDPVSVEARKRALARRRAAQREVKKSIDVAALTDTPASLAADEQRRIEIEETQARLSEMGADAPPPIRLVRTAVDGQSDKVDQAERMAMAAGAEHYDDGEESVIDALVEDFRREEERNRAARDMAEPECITFAIDDDDDQDDDEEIDVDGITTLLIGADDECQEDGAAYPWDE